MSQHLPVAQPGVGVPPEWYDVQAQNEIGLAVYGHLLGVYRECAELLRRHTQSSYLNLVAVFFHEFQKILSNHFVLTYEKRWGADLPFKERAISNGLLGPRGTARKFAGSFIRWWWRRGISGRGGSQSSSRALPTVRYTENLGLDLGAIRRALRGSGRLVPVRLRDPKVALPDLEGQLNLLLSSIERLASGLTDSHDIGPPDTGALVRRLESVAAAHTANVNTPLEGDALVTGSLLALQARLYAVLAKEAQVPVVTIFHGEAFGVLDEPVVGYGERTYNDIVIGYGVGGKVASLVGQYNQGLFGETPRYIGSSARQVRGIYTSSAIPLLSGLSRRKTLYVPTLLGGQALRYGPFRDLSDAAYMEWQTRLLAALVARFGAPVGWKRHPRDRVNMRASVPGVKTYRKELLQEVIGDHDVLVFDYFSSAFSIAAATNKPIVYLDIGLRNFSPAGLDAIKRRCIYVKTSPMDPESALQTALELSGKTCIDDFTPAFSLAGDLPREEVVAATLCSVLDRARSR